jgi:hypothetical protein
MSIKVTGCRLFPRWFASQTEERKALIRERVSHEKFKHLYPCPKANGGWGYKVSCIKCGNAIKQDGGQPDAQAQAKEKPAGGKDLRAVEEKLPNQGLN